ncbi:YdcH family protein [Loktanella agnita]|uniref:YdcH family protein n=1 Tax=Loktanella agnita TaxID=287097 RepID=UPI003985F23E
MNTSAKMEQLEVLRVELEVLKREHRDLDEAIAALHGHGSADMLTLKRLKKQKLSLKDKIVTLEDRIFPDIIA